MQFHPLQANFWPLLYDGICIPVHGENQIGRGQPLNSLIKEKNCSVTSTIHETVAQISFIGYYCPFLMLY